MKGIIYWLSGIMNAIYQLSLIKLLEVAIKKCGGNVKKDMNGKPPLVIGESLIDHVQYAKELIHWLKE